MLERSRENFTLLTGDIISNAFGQNAWAENNLAEASIDLTIQDHIKPGLLQSEWDLIIFDEAHKLSSYRYGKGQIRRTQRDSIAEELSKRTRHILSHVSQG